MSTRKQTKETKQQANAPALIAYQVTAGKDGGKAFWQRCGAAWPNKAGGFQLRLNAMPLGGDRFSSRPARATRGRRKPPLSHEENSHDFRSHLRIARPQLGVIELVRAGTDAAKSESSSLMDLHFDRLYESDSGIVISLTHYFEQNGDLCRDPDMEVRIDLRSRTAEALTFQQAIPPAYQRVYSDRGKCNPALKTALNGFLADWLPATAWPKATASRTNLRAARKRRSFHRRCVI